VNKYFEFIFQQAGAPPPEKIVILKHPEDWANRQILDEFHLAWPSANVTLIETGSFPICDLAVIPFDGDASDGLFPFVSKGHFPWVMLYGLNNRQIRVLKFDDTLKFLRTAQRLHRVYHMLLKTGSLGVLKAALRFWKLRIHPSRMQRLLKIVLPVPGRQNHR
jgi:hypothetical protein